MRKTMRLILILALVLSFVTTGAWATGDAGAESQVKVGLFYGGGALSSANLQNKEGSGYSFGYYDETRSFVPLMTTEEIKISVSRDDNMDFSGGSYALSVSSAPLLGGWHIQLDQVFSTWEEAQAEASAYPGGFPAYEADQWVVRFGQYASLSAAEADLAAGAAGEAAAFATGGSRTGVTVSVTGTASILMEFDCGGGRNLAILPTAPEGGKAITWFKNYRYYGGFEYLRAVGGNVTVSNVVGLEDYVKGVIPYEMSASWPTEAKKAGAVCARTYVCRALAASKHAGLGFDICNTTDCQVYRGTGGANEASDLAVDETAGVCVYYEGKLAETLYHSSDGGATEDAKNVWGSEVPYLTGVPDPYEADVADRINNYYWSVTYSAYELTDLLRGAGYSVSAVADVAVSETTAMGNALKVSFVDEDGVRYHFSRAKAKSIFSGGGKSLRSQRFTIDPLGTGGAGFSVNESGQVLDRLSDAYSIGGSGQVSQLGSGQLYAVGGTGTGALAKSGGTGVVVNGSGWGHNVGLSQWGTYAMANRGYTYDEILEFYYSGVSLEVR